MSERKMQNLYSGKVQLPYKLEKVYNCNYGGAHGGASCEFFPAQALINQRISENLSPFLSVKFSYQLNGKTRKRSKNWLRNQMLRDGKRLMDRFRSVGLVRI